MTHGSNARAYQPFWRAVTPKGTTNRRVLATRRTALVITTKDKGTVKKKGVGLKRLHPSRVRLMFSWPLGLMTDGLLAVQGRTVRDVGHDAKREGSCLKRHRQM